MADAPTNQEFPTILGPDASFKGELTFEKGLRLMGKLEGKINTPGRLHVAKEARMQADVESGSVVVEGDVRGNLTANDRIELKSTARYEGDLRASKLTVDEGAIFSGHVAVGPEAVKGGAPGGARPQQGAQTGGPRPGATGPAQPQTQPVK
jgi:cytoskeletal protein CcmA (bactofilin family)